MRNHWYHITIYIFLWFSTLAFASTMEDGVQAYDAGNFLTAKRIFQQYAELGDPISQRYLAEMYDRGRGVHQDYSKAIIWYKKAAKQSDLRAQYLLGVKYVNGHGVKKNEKAAYAWFAIAFNAGYLKAADPLKFLNRTMPLKERQEALNMAVDQLIELP